MERTTIGLGGHIVKRTSIKALKKTKREVRASDLSPHKNLFKFEIERERKSNCDPYATTKESTVADNTLLMD